MSSNGSNGNGTTRDIVAKLWSLCHVLRDDGITYTDYVTELTKSKIVEPETFARLARYYSEREICEIVWLVASEHLYNMTNIGLNIHSDMLCDISRKRSESAAGV